MGLGKIFTRTAAAGPQEGRAVSWNFPIVIDGQEVYPRPPLYRGAMSIPGAWRSVNLIADLLGSVPWNAYRMRRGEPVELMDPTPPLLEQPNPQETRMSTISGWAMDLVWHGNAVGVVAARDANGRATAVLPVPADAVGVRRVNSSDYSPLPTGAIEYNVGGQSFSEFEVIHFKGPCRPGDVRGFGVLEAHMSTLDLSHELQEQAASIGRHGVPTGVLESENPDLTKDEAADLKAGWLRSQRERSIAVLNSTTKFKPLAWNPEQLELVESRKFSLHEIALIFGLPLSFLGADQSSRTYSNIEQEAINLIKFTLSGHLARFEQTLSAQLPRGTVAKANLDALLRADTLTRYQAHQNGITGGFLTRDEVRELEDRPPLTPEQIAAAAPPRPEPAPGDEQAEKTEQDPTEEDEKP